MKRTHIKSILLTATASLILLCTACDGMYVGVGGSLDDVYPDGTVSVGIGGTVPIDPGLPGYSPWYNPAPRPGWNSPGWGTPAWPGSPYWHHTSWGGSPAWHPTSWHPGPGPGPGPYLPY